MSALTDEIRATCTEIAANQKEIYQLGYEKGRASVKHIKFTVYSPEDVAEFCALSGMSWREYVDSDVADERIFIQGDKVYYSEYVRKSYWLGCNADDEIVADGIYYCFSIILEGKGEFYIRNGYNFGKSLEEYNTDKYYIDENECIRAKDGRFILWSEGVGGVFKVFTYDYYEYMISYFLSPDTDLITFNLEYHTNTVAKRGSTWAEYCDSIYSNGTWFVNGDSVTGWSSELIQLNGVNVKPDDVIIEGANYELAYQ